MADDGLATSDPYNDVLPRLAVGKELLPGSLARLGYDVAVRCLRGESKDGLVQVVHAPLTDDAFEIVRGDWERACKAASAVVDHIKQGRRCYVYCREGMNRSALVAALAVRELKRCTGREACSIVRQARPGSLYNWHFRSALKALTVPVEPLTELPQPQVKRR